MSNQYTDLPPDLLRLARRLARDCASPGTYTITLTIAADPKQSLIAEINKLLPVATVTGSRRKQTLINR